MMKNFLILTFLFFAAANVHCQILTGIETKWNDSFVEWTIFTDDEDEEGDLTMRWQMKMDWTEWDYRLGEVTGVIKQKWKNNPREWEVRGEGEVVNIRMKWNNDITEWTISDGTNSFTLESKFTNELNEWEIKNSKVGAFEIFTEWENDPRVWGIVDELNEEISLPLKMAFTFIAIYHSSPKQ